jgi:hypothetical protein
MEARLRDKPMGQARIERCKKSSEAYAEDDYPGPRWRICWMSKRGLKMGTRVHQNW